MICHGSCTAQFEFSSVDSNAVQGAREIHGAFHAEVEQARRLVTQDPGKGKQSLLRAAALWNQYVQLHERSRTELTSYSLKGGTGVGGLGVAGYAAFGTLTGGLGAAGLGLLGIGGIALFGKKEHPVPRGDPRFSTLEQGLFYSLQQPTQQRSLLFTLLDQKLIDEAQDLLRHREKTFNPASFFIREGIVSRFKTEKPHPKLLPLIEQNIRLDQEEWVRTVAWQKQEMQSVAQSPWIEKLELFSELLKIDLQDYDPSQDNLSLGVEGMRKTARSSHSGRLLPPWSLSRWSLVGCLRFILPPPMWIRSFTTLKAVRLTIY